MKKGYKQWWPLFHHTQNVLIMYTWMYILTSASLERLKKSYIKKLNIYGRETEGEKWLDFLMTISLCFYMNLYIYNQRKNKKTRRGSWVNNHKLFLGTEGDGTMISQKHWWANLDSKGVFGSDRKWSSPELKAQNPSSAGDTPLACLFWSGLSGPRLSLSCAVTEAASTQ